MRSRAAVPPILLLFSTGSTAPGSPEPIGRGGSPELSATGVGTPSQAGRSAPRHERGDSALVLREGTNMQAVLSPDGSRIALGLQGTIWTLPAAGGETTALTDGLGDDHLPDWSPDGKRVAFQSFRRGSWDVWAVGAEGGDLAPLTSGRDDDREPVWSPDGRRIAFSSDRAGTYDVWLLDVKSGETSALTRSSGNEFMPAWSPDGTTLAFLQKTAPDSTDLMRITLLDRKEEKIASFKGDGASPTWSPDGKSIVLTLLQQGAVSTLIPEVGSSDLVRISVSGGEMTRLTSFQDVFPFRPSWTRDGDLLYTADGKIKRLAIASGQTQTVDFSVAVMLDRPSYTRRKPWLPEDDAEIPVRGVVRPVISPDGRFFTFCALGDLWIAAVEDGKPYPLTRDGFLDSDPYWSPDGKRIAFASDRHGSMDIWVAPIDESPARTGWKLTNLPGAEWAPAWSPDGKLIAFLDEQGSVHTVPAEGGASTLLRKVVGSAGMPSWSSDSRHVAVAVREASSTRFREGANRVLVLSLDGGEADLLEEPRASFGTRAGDGPVWSPDGRSLAIATDGGLSLVPVTSSGRSAGPMRRLVDEPVDYPSWSGDGKKLLYLFGEKLKLLDVESGRADDVPLQMSYRLPGKSGKLVLQGVRVIDGTGAPPRENVDVVLSGSRIQSIDPSGGALPEDVRVIDGRGRTVIPGLIEMHTHPTLPAIGSRNGRIWLAYGITSIRTPAASPYGILEEREAIEAGIRVGPRIFFTGYILDGDRIYYNGSLALDDEPELLRELERAFRLRYDLLKTYVRLPDSLQKSIIERAHANGIPVTSHEVYPAVALGVDGIEHVRGTSRRGFSPKVSELRRSYQDVLDLISRSGVYFTPTIVIQGGFRLARARDPELLSDPRLNALFPPWLVEPARAAPAGDVAEREAAMKPLFRTVDAVAKAGGKVIAGTDSPIVPYGLSLILEIEQYSEAGLGPLQAIRTATQTAAEALGAGKDLGTVEPGKLADVVVLDGNPAEDIRNLRRVAHVIVGGRAISLERLLEHPWAERKASRSDDDAR